jgi:hypothetical protein
MGSERGAATIRVMVAAPWTYELPVTGSAAENLDDYEVRTSDGHIGVATGLVARDGELYVLVDAGRLPPLTHQRLAFRLADVAEIDHDALLVRLAVDRGHLDEAALALDPAKARHGAGAEAVRVRELPAGMATSPVAPGREGPVETASSLVALVGATLGPYLLLVVVALWATRGLVGLEYAAFVVPALVALAGFAAAGYRIYRAPHMGHHAPTAPAGPPGRAGAPSS